MRRIRMRAPMRVSTGVVDLGAERMNGPREKLSRCVVQTGGCVKAPYAA
jgi:hypothetical protein